MSSRIGITLRFVQQEGKQFTLLLLVLVVGLGRCSSAALSQDRPLSLDAPVVGPELPASAESIIGTNQFWVVSSRGCPQDAAHIGCCRLSVWNVRCDAVFSDTCSEESSRCWSSTVCEQGIETLQTSLIPGVPVCVLIHGSFVSMEDVVTQTLQTLRWLQAAEPNRPLQLVAFTWPSESLTHIPQIDIGVLGKRSSVNGFYLARTMRSIPVESPVCLLAHSHGARTVSAFLHLTRGGTVEGYSLPAGADAGHRLRAVFAASAIDHDWFNPGQRFDRALCRLEGLISMVNRRDWALGLYPLRKIGSSRALGKVGLTRKDYRRLGGDAARVHELDVTPLIGKPHVWPNYYERPSIAAAISTYVFFNDEFPPPAYTSSATTSASAVSTTHTSEK